mgnify:CR=1 FL=1
MKKTLLFIIWKGWVKIHVKVKNRVTENYLLLVVLSETAMFGKFGKRKTTTIIQLLSL